jgi:hypothetical protein
VMLVFALLFALHIVTHALKNEVIVWAGEAIRNNAYVYGRGEFAVNPALLKIPDEVHAVHYSGRTPWPSSVLAVNTAELAAADGSGGDACPKGQ